MKEVWTLSEVFYDKINNEVNLHRTGVYDNRNAAVERMYNIYADGIEGALKMAGQITSATFSENDSDECYGYIETPTDKFVIQLQCESVHGEDD
jgi:hypothetical protein